MRIAREAAGVTQAKLAERIGIEPATLSRYEAGIYQVTLPVLYRVAQTLEIPIAQLIDVSAPPPNPAHAIDAADQELLDEWRQLAARDRRAVRALMRSLRGGAPDA